MKKQDKLAQVVSYCTKNLNLTEEQTLKIINELKKAPSKVRVKWLTEKALVICKNPESKDFKLMMNQIFKLNDGSYQSKQDILDEIQKEKDLNLPKDPNAQTLEENHETIKKSLKLVCDRFNELGIDYYIVGALPMYLMKEKLIRYHDDIDFMVAEKDLTKVAQALKGTPFEFKDHRLDSTKVYDKTDNLTNGEHEVMAQRTDNEFHLGFFLFKRQEDKVEVREYHAKLDEKGNKIPLIHKRIKSKEQFDAEYGDNYVECYGTKFKCSTPESVYGIKRYTQDQPGRHKDKVDADTWERWKLINKDKIKEMKEIRTKKPEETEKKEVSQNLVKQILEQQKEIENIQQSANEYSYD